MTVILKRMGAAEGEAVPPTPLGKEIFLTPIFVSKHFGIILKFLSRRSNSGLRKIVPQEWRVFYF